MTMAKDYDYDQRFPGRFLKSGEFQGRDATLTIRDIDLEEMEERKGVKTKCILSFRETKKQLVLNRTNGECLKGMFGRATRDWIGKRVTFYPATVEAFGAPTLAIRVRGSPDIARDLEVTCKVGRQGDVRVTMKRTGQKPANGKPAGAVQAPQPPPDYAEAGPDTVPEPPPDYDPMTGEAPFNS
jgi:hypothetical protein